MSTFVQLINELDFWLLEDTATKVKVFENQIFSKAKDVTDWVASNGGWPSDFDNQDAKNLIVALANQYNSDQLKNKILDNIKIRVLREEPKGSTTTGQGFSFNKWNEIQMQNSSGKVVKGFENSNNPLFTNDQIMGMIEFGLNLKNLPPLWITGIITKAFRIKKGQTIAETKQYLQNASDMLKPVSEGGRGGRLYCFPSEVVQSKFEEKIEENFIDKYGIRNYLSSGGKLNNTFYGGSGHTKKNPLPPDVDMVSYITKQQMLNLYSHTLENINEALREVDQYSVVQYDLEDIKKRLTKDIKKTMQDGDMRVALSNILFWDFSSDEVHKMADEADDDDMMTSINGVSKNILQFLTVAETVNKKRIDFVFFTQEAARNGRSIPPETQIQF